MDFKDLAIFNDALLTKQAWRLLHHKDSLFYRVFKSKFFPNCSIMEATNSSAGSYAWQSILKGRDVLLKGAKWRVGNGESIGVWLDAWLPYNDHPRICSPTVEVFEESRVADLIDPSTKQWDSSLLRGLFNPQEVKMIQSIPVCHSSVEDKLIWPYTSSGQCTVQSGYRFLAKETPSNPVS